MINFRGAGPPHEVPDVEVPEVPEVPEVLPYAAGADPDPDPNPEARYVTCDHVLQGRNGDEYRFTGRLLGASTSRRDRHSHRSGYAPRGWMCGACRWFEVAIYRVETAEAVADPNLNPSYVVHTRGMSRVPGERTFARVVRAQGPDYVIYSLIQRPRSQPRVQVDSGPGTPLLPAASVDAVEDSADRDRPLAAAYDRWLEAGLRLGGAA